jgi:cardiolipin synthase
LVSSRNRDRDEKQARLALRAMADQALSRAAGAPLIPGNRVRLLRDGRENYPAWLEAIGTATHHVYFENYIIREDETGRDFADALIAQAQKKVSVRLIYDWMGGIGRASGRFWSRLRQGGVEVRCYNPPHLDSPFGWLSRDHRKMVAVDGRVGFISGLCVGQMWLGDPKKKMEPWRDTGVEVGGPAVSQIEKAFAQVWAMTGEPIPTSELGENEVVVSAGDMAMRVVASIPAAAGMIRLDELVTALARRRLWLTDAYFAGTPSYVQALKAAALDGVDVRLLVPNGTDIPFIRPLSKAGYRPLLEAGVRVFEWNGTMIHAKTAVADEQWARVGSTNLNVASWLGNCELDAVVENESFACSMTEMYLQDLANATEIVLGAKHRGTAPSEKHRLSVGVGKRGSAGRATAGAIRVGNAIGAAVANRRLMEPVEAHIMIAAGLTLLVLSVLVARFPQILTYPLIMLFLWTSVALLYRGAKLYWQRKNREGPGANPEA